MGALRAQGVGGWGGAWGGGRQEGAVELRGVGGWGLGLGLGVWGVWGGAGRAQRGLPGACGRAADAPCPAAAVEAPPRPAPPTRPPPTALPRRQLPGGWAGRLGRAAGPGGWAGRLGRVAGPGGWAGRLGQQTAGAGEAQRKAWALASTGQRRQRLPQQGGEGGAPAGRLLRTWRARRRSRRRSPRRSRRRSRRARSWGSHAAAAGCACSPPGRRARCNGAGGYGSGAAPVARGGVWAGQGRAERCAGQPGGARRLAAWRALITSWRRAPGPGQQGSAVSWAANQHGRAQQGRPAWAVAEQVGRLCVEEGVRCRCAPEHRAGQRSYGWCVACGRGAGSWAASVCARLPVRVPVRVCACKRAGVRASVRWRRKPSVSWEGRAPARAPGGDAY
jgi:hypothetical protein